MASSILLFFYYYFLEIQRDKVMIVSFGKHRASKTQKKTIYIYIYLLMNNKSPNPNPNYLEGGFGLLLLLLLFLEDDFVLKELVTHMYEKVMGSTFVVLQLQMRTGEAAKVTQERAFTSLSWGPVSAAPRKDCPIFPCQLLPVLSHARIPSRSVGQGFVFALLIVVRRPLWLHWVTVPQREIGVPGPWTIPPW